MNLKIGIGLVVVVIVAALLLTGMLGKLIGLAISLAIWGFTGYLAGNLVQGEGYGFLGNILLGMLGGFVGSILVTIVGMTGLIKLPFIGGILVGVLGAVIVIVVSRFFGGGEAE